MKNIQTMWNAHLAPRRSYAQRHALWHQHSISLSTNKDYVFWVLLRMPHDERDIQAGFKVLKIFRRTLFRKANMDFESNQAG